MTRPSHSASAIMVNRRRSATVNEDVRVSTPATGFSRNAPRMAAVLGILALLGGCSAFGLFSAQQTLHGNRVDQYRLVELVPGTSTQADVTALVGSPTAKATFDPNTWLYISEVTQPRIARTPGVDDQAVVALVFDDNGVLREMKKLDQANALPVTVVAGETPSPGTSASFLQQLFGNVGRFNPVGATGPAAGGGSPAGINGL